MKVLAVVLISTIGNVAAFVTSNHRPIVTPRAATAELDGLVGVDIESGKKIVRIVIHVISINGCILRLFEYSSSQIAVPHFLHPPK